MVKIVPYSLKISRNYFNSTKIEKKDKIGIYQNVARYDTLWRNMSQNPIIVRWKTDEEEVLKAKRKREKRITFEPGEMNYDRIREAAKMHNITIRQFILRAVIPHLKEITDRNKCENNVDYNKS